MRKTFCDRCGTQCVNVTIHLNGAVSHTTNQGEIVGTDEIRPFEVCKNCFTLLQELLGLTVVPQERDDFGPQDSRAVLARPAPPPLRVSEVP
jgi:hypothetical protein